jgi:flavodoxin
VLEASRVSATDRSGPNRVPARTARGAGWPSTCTVALLKHRGMTTAAIIYCSDTWTTAGLADDIAAHLAERGVETSVAAIEDTDPAGLGAVDYLFLGCWTHGWFVVNQHPDQRWVDWARRLPRLEHPRVALFTTYKIRTGSMFPRMRRILRGKAPRIDLELKAKGRHLTDDGRAALDDFLGR